MSKFKKGDKFTYDNPKYPVSSVNRSGKVMIAADVDATHIEKEDTEGELVVRRYPIEYCTKVYETSVDNFKKELGELLEKYNADIYVDLDGDTHGLLSALVIDFNNKEVLRFNNPDSISHYDLK